MTEQQLKAAKRLEFRIQRLQSFIDTTERMASFCNATDVHEDEATTAACKKLLLDDLRSKLAIEQAEFESL